MLELSEYPEVEEEVQLGGKEFFKCDFRDKRLNKRAVKIGMYILRRPGSILLQHS